MTLWGLVSWLIAGLALGALFRLLTRPWLAAAGVERGWPGNLLLGCGGALLGGLVSTGLGFGGLAAYDPRSLTLSSLTALLVLLTDRWLALYFLRSSPTR